MTSKNVDNTENHEFEPVVNSEHEIVDEGHHYDGIEELDNPPPGWIMAIFYVTIAISIFYGAYYFWLNVGDLQDVEYAKKTEAHDQKFKKDNEASASLALLTDEASVSAGATIYKDMNCAACHGVNGEGNAIGPNLTDDYWLHGGKFENVFSLIKNGFPTKGMTAFKTQLNDEKIQQVASYVLVHLKGTNPPNAKEPQGEKITE
jgi:cytochrome c oxidase cbb3-type subunit 3